MREKKERVGGSEGERGERGEEGERRGGDKVGVEWREQASANASACVQDEGEQENRKRKTLQSTMGSEKPSM